jgi:hypothetical protein
MTMPYIQNLFLPLFLIICFEITYAQKIKISELILAPGFYSENIPSNSINDFYTLAPN